ncbi:hypothetical protein AOC40_11050 [Listeria monocytogenes]|nr:hypothetical protein [Listeria monocytogenes]ECH7282355.1 hypothetical protein [Listeria monocytogenes]EKZ1004562.1 hypothetical protein [Listeria monocytogenes]EKZ1010227.1 hypothetical protein [Listeria monocytogenes]MCJ38594.1 hypothetical protein [Listeria monocytogenes]
MKIQSYENKLVKDKLEIDYYVPITITFSENADKYKLGELFYYLFINEHDSIVEVKVNAITQKIMELVVVSINDIEDSDLVVEKCTEKNPLIQTTIFDDYPVITKKTKFKMFRAHKKIYFKFDEAKISTIVKMSSHVGLLLNQDNKIVGMEFSGFTEDEWKELDESIKCKSAL